MLVIDTSALIAVLFAESSAPQISEVIDAADARFISAANYIELGTVLAGRRQYKPDQVVGAANRILNAAMIEVVPISSDLAETALHARIRFGKGFGVRGGLNFGDCFAYALAKSMNAPLLYTGNDFSKTDIRSALPAAEA